MALDGATIQSDVALTVKEALLDAFPESTPPSDNEEIMEALAGAIAAAVPVIIDAIKTTADLKGVTAGSDTVRGDVDNGVD